MENTAVNGSDNAAINGSDSAVNDFWEEQGDVTQNTALLGDVSKPRTDIDTISTKTEEIEGVAKSFVTSEEADFVDIIEVLPENKDLGDEIQAPIDVVQSNEEVETELKVENVVHNDDGDGLNVCEQSEIDTENESIEITDSEGVAKSEMHSPIVEVSFNANGENLEEDLVSSKVLNDSSAGKKEGELLSNEVSDEVGGEQAREDFVSNEVSGDESAGKTEEILGPDQVADDVTGGETEEKLVGEEVSNEENAKEIEEEIFSNEAPTDVQAEPDSSPLLNTDEVGQSKTDAQDPVSDKIDTESILQQVAEPPKPMKDAVTESGISTQSTELPSTEEPKENEWLDILGNGLLKKKVLVSGKGPDSRPKPGNEVALIVNGELKDGTKLKEEKVVFVMDDRDVVQALEMGVALMEVEEKSLLYTDSKYAYGPFGCSEAKPVIPKNCDITYELELISVNEGPNREKLSDDERVQMGDKKRLRGNSLYTRGDFGGAIECYKRGLKYLEGSAGNEVIDMKVKCQNNLSAAQLKVNAFQAALQSCNNVLALQPENVKAIFRKAKCLEALSDTKEALKCLKEASMLDPSNKLVSSELLRLGKYLKESQQKESDMYKRMVEGLKKDKPDEDDKTDDNFSFKVMVGTLLVVGIGVLAGFLWNKH